MFYNGFLSFPTTIIMKNNLILKIAIEFIRTAWVELCLIEKNEACLMKQEKVFTNL